MRFSSATLETARETIAWVRSRIMATNDLSLPLGSSIKARKTHEIRVIPDQAERIETTLKDCSGNCAEMTELAMLYVTKRYRERFSVYYNEASEGDHCFMIMKETAAPDEDDAWIICDPWGNIACHWNEREPYFAELEKAQKAGARRYISYINDLITEATKTELAHLRAVPSEEDGAIGSLYHLLEYEISFLISPIITVDRMLYRECVGQLNAGGPISFFNWAKRENFLSEIYEHFQHSQSLKVESRRYDITTDEIIKKDIQDIPDRLFGIARLAWPAPATLPSSTDPTFNPPAPSV